MKNKEFTTYIFCPHCKREVEGTIQVSGEYPTEFECKNCNKKFQVITRELFYSTFLPITLKKDS